MKTFGRNVQKTLKKFACFSFHVGLRLINFSFFKPDTENNADFDVVSSKCGNFSFIHSFAQSVQKQQ